MINARSFWTYDGSPPRNIPCEPDSGDLKIVSFPFRPLQVLNDGYCLRRYRGMYQPITPVIPFEPITRTDLSLM